MGDVGETWQAVKPYLKQESIRRRADNRERSTALLLERGIRFTSHNDGAHLIVEGRDGKIDFWPGTGKFITRTGKRGRGVLNLIKLCL